MGSHFVMKIRCDVIDNYENLHDFFRYRSVDIAFWKSFMPPHRVEYIIGPLTEEGVFNTMEQIENFFNDLDEKYSEAYNENHRPYDIRVVDYLDYLKAKRLDIQRHIDHWSKRDG